MYNLLWRERNFTRHFTRNGKKRLIKLNFKVKKNNSTVPALEKYYYLYWKHLKIVWITCYYNTFSYIYLVRSIVRLHIFKLLKLQKTKRIHKILKNDIYSFQVIENKNKPFIKILISTQFRLTYANFNYF